MLTQEATKEMLHEWKEIWNTYKDRLEPNRKSGQELIDYLLGHYPLTELFDERALQVIALNVTENEHLRRRLPGGAPPSPRAFYLENKGNGSIFYKRENRDDDDVWGGTITRIFVGVDTASGFYVVEGSTMLWDELYAFQGIDEADIKNPYCVAEYIACRKRFGLWKEI